MLLDQIIDVLDQGFVPLDEAFPFLLAACKCLVLVLGVLLATS